MPVSNVATATFFYNHHSGGFSESVTFGDVSVSEAKIRAKRYWEFRRGLVATDVSLVYATVNYLGAARDSWRLQLNYPIPGIGGMEWTGLPDDSETCNNLADSILIRLQLNNGNRANRHLRGVPDFCAKGGSLQFGLGACTALAGEDPPAAANYGVAIATQLTNFLKFLVKDTVTAKGVLSTATIENPGPNQIVHYTQWDLFQYGRGEAIRSATKRVGKAYAPFRGRRSNRPAE